MTPRKPVPEAKWTRKPPVIPDPIRKPAKGFASELTDVFLELLYRMNPPADESSTRHE